MKLDGDFTQRYYQAANAVMNQITTRQVSLGSYPLANLVRAAKTMPQGPSNPDELLAFLASFVPAGPHVSLAVGTTGVERPFGKTVYTPQGDVEVSLCVWDAHGALAQVIDSVCAPPFPVKGDYERDLAYSGLKPTDLIGAPSSATIASQALDRIREASIPLVCQDVTFALANLARDAQGLTWTSEVPTGAEGASALVGTTPLFDLMALSQVSFPYGHRSLAEVHRYLTEVLYGSVPEPVDAVRELYRKDPGHVSMSSYAASGQNRSLRKAIMVGQAAEAARRIFSDPELFVRLETYLPDPMARRSGAPAPQTFFIPPNPFDQSLGNVSHYPQTRR